MVNFTTCFYLYSHYSACFSLTHPINIIPIKFCYIIMYVTSVWLNPSRMIRGLGEHVFPDKKKENYTCSSTCNTTLIHLWWTSAVDLKPFWFSWWSSQHCTASKQTVGIPEDSLWDLRRPETATIKPVTTLGQALRGPMGPGDHTIQMAKPLTRSQRLFWALSGSLACKCYRRKPLLHKTTNRKKHVINLSHVGVVQTIH